MVNQSEHLSHASFPIFKAIDPNPKSRLDKFLNLFADVRGGEGLGVILLFLNALTLMSGYYLLKTVRKPLILALGGATTENKAIAGQAVMLLLIIPLYGWLATKFKRTRLLSGVSVFFALNLAAFYLAGVAGMKVGVVFYLWVGIFSVFVVSQFWAFANDLYTEPQGKRLFALIAIGSSAGALLGSNASGILSQKIGILPQMLIAAAMLLLTIPLMLIADRHETARGGERQKTASQSPLAAGDGFALVFKDRYLLLIALVVVVLNVVNTSGELLLSQFVTQQAALAAGAGPGAEEAQSRFIGAFYGNFFSWVNFVGFLFQTFLVSRIFRFIGVRGALYVLPLLALGGYSLLLAAPLLGVIKVIKVVENSTDYSLQNTAKQALFLPTSREVKYKAKAAIDTFFMRFGDLAQAAIFAAGVKLGLSLQGFFTLNIALIGVWLALVTALFFEHRRRTLTPPGPAPAPQPAA